MSETSPEVVKRYLHDALAAEKSLAAHFKEFVQEGDYREAIEIFRECEATALNHSQRLSARLDSMGEMPSRISSLFRIFRLGEKAEQIDFGASEDITQKLLLAYTVTHGEIAMYEVLAMVGEAAGDTEAQSIALLFQQDEKVVAEKIWRLFAAASQREFKNLNA
jgi:ferritin-like metal-binding protein YciE